MEEFLRYYGPLLVAFASLVFSVHAARSKASDERFGKIETKIEAGLAKKADAEVQTILVAKLDVAEGAISSLQGELRHLPSREQTHNLELALQGLRGEIGVLTERLKPISYTSERLQEFLIGEAAAKRAEEKRSAA